MDKHEWELLDKLLCAAYDGKPITIQRFKRGKIVVVEVHETGVEADGI